MKQYINNKIRHLYNAILNACYRRKLRNNNFTIITDTCIGGVMYHKLGKQFLSPTINLWMHDVDFYNFINHLKEYLAMELKFVRGVADYPTAYLGDILIHFNHYHTEEEAASKWYERCKRINYDNLFIICSDRPCGDAITYEQIASLKSIPCKGKVVFSNRHYDDIDYLVPLPKDKDGDYVNAYMFDKTKFLGRWRWETAWDWVHWLNTGEIKRK